MWFPRRPVFCRSVYFRSFTIAALAALLFAASDRLPAQTSTGELSLTVLDPSGATFPNVSLTLTGSQTGNEVRSLRTNGQGLADAPLLPPGSYDIAASAGSKPPSAREL